MIKKNYQQIKLVLSGVVTKKYINKSIMNEFGHMNEHWTGIVVSRLLFVLTLFGAFVLCEKMINLFVEWTILKNQESLKNEKSDKSRNNNMTLEKRMDNHRKETVHELNNVQPYVVHLTLRYTMGKLRINDPVKYRSIMKAVAAKLLTRFTPRTVHVYSREISLVFYPGNKLYGGKVQKISSAISSVAGQYFHECANVTDQGSYFTADTFNLPDSVEVYNYLWFHQKINCVRRSVHRLVNKHKLKGKFYKVSNKNLIKSLQDKGVEWNDEPKYDREGIIYKLQRDENERYCTVPAIKKCDYKTLTMLEQEFYEN